MNFELEFNESDHTYKIDGVYVPGTTTITDNMPKVLTWWASGEACQKFGWLNPKKNLQAVCEKAASDMLQRLKVMGLPEYMGLLKSAYYAHNEKKEQAADFGSKAHEWFEYYVKAKITGNLNGESKLPDIPEVKNAVELFLKWEKQYSPKWLESEVVIGSKVHMFGGKFDAVAVIDGLITMIDFKTSAGVYESYFAQTAAYKLAYEETFPDKPKIAQRLVLWVPKTGNEFGHHIVKTSQDYDIDAFMGAFKIYRYLQYVKNIKKESANGNHRK